MVAVSQKALSAELLLLRRLVDLPGAARSVGLSLSSLYRARKVIQVCDPDLERLMDSRELSIIEASRLAALSEEERREVLALPAGERKEEARRLLKVRRTKPPRPRGAALLTDKATLRGIERWEARLAGARQES